MEIKSKKYIVSLLITVFGLIALISSTSYAILRGSSVSSNIHIVRVGSVELEVNEKYDTMETGFSIMKDTDGLQLDSVYEFTITNIGSVPAKYDLKLLNNAPSGQTALDDSYIRIGLEVNGQEMGPMGLSNVNNVIDSNTINNEEVIRYKMRVWLDKTKATQIQANSTKKAYLSLKVEAKQAAYTKKPSYVDTMKKLANTNQTIDFSQAPSDTNGNGINILEGTENDANPIYFYRGFDTEGKHVVSNNNVLFGGFCWKIVRTTDTGGIKIVYNGEPTDGKCTNTTGTATQLSLTSAFNSSYKSPAYNGYMYGTVYSYTKAAATSGSLFGSSFTYSGGTYTLTNTTSAADNTHHYTCNNTTGTCSTIRYYYYISGSNNYYIELTNGKSVSDALSEMQTNTTDSTIKTVIDNWYETNLASYEEYLEDTVWCNDRSIYQLNGWNPEGGDLTKDLYYKGYERNRSTYKPSVTCQNKNDAFTVSDTTKGNGKLTYPVALLTADELTMAGSGSPGYSTSSYLYTNQYWWSLSPFSFGGNYANEFGLYSGGYLGTRNVNDSRGVRPAVSLAPGTSFTSGDGSGENPYKVE